MKKIEHVRRAKAVGRLLAAVLCSCASESTTQGARSGKVRRRLSLAFPSQYHMHLPARDSFLSSFSHPIRQREKEKKEGLFTHDERIILELDP